MRPITVTLVSPGVSAGILMNWRITPFNVGIGCVVSGSVVYNVEHSFENPPTNWFQNANISEATTSLDTNYMFPVQFVRLNLVSGSGSVTMTLIQSGGVPG